MLFVATDGMLSCTLHTTASTAHYSAVANMKHTMLKTVPSAVQQRFLCPPPPLFMLEMVRRVPRLVQSAFLSLLLQKTMHRLILWVGLKAQWLLPCDCQGPYKGVARTVCAPCKVFVCPLIWALHFATF